MGTSKQRNAINRPGSKRQRDGKRLTTLFKREYRSFKHARERCNDPSRIHYYGKGIKFNFSSFEEFLNEVGVRPIGTTLDRINSDGHYEIGNVRWATRKQQCANKSRIGVALRMVSGC